MIMKNIIIFGEPISGKSTLANMIIDKFNYQVIHVDAVRDTFKEIYPELNIAPDIAINNKKFQLFIQEYLNRNTKQEERNKYGYVVEGCETSVDDCNRLFNTDENIIYYLAPDDITPEEFFNNIRANDTEKDWTFKLSDEELMQKVKNMITKGKKIKEECKKYNIKFVDTSHNRKEKLNTILKNIESEIKINQ